MVMPRREVLVQLDDDLVERLDELAPRHLQVPSGSRIAIDYAESPPVLAVRLQELFGLAATPRIAGGRQSVLLHLLSPDKTGNVRIEWLAGE